MDQLDKRKKGGLSNKKYILWGTGGYGLKYDILSSKYFLCPAALK